MSYYKNKYYMKLWIKRYNKDSLSETDINKYQASLKFRILLQLVLTSFRNLEKNAIELEKRIKERKYILVEDKRGNKKDKL